MKNLTTRRAMIISLALVFAFLFVLNCFTPYQADDFAYHFRFDNSAPLTSIADIIPSMAAHAEMLNGRLAAHSLVQLFELLPGSTSCNVLRGVRADARLRRGLPVA